MKSAGSSFVSSLTRCSLHVTGRAWTWKTRWSPGRYRAMMFGNEGGWMSQKGPVNDPDKGVQLAPAPLSLSCTVGRPLSLVLDHGRPCRGSSARRGMRGELREGV